MIQNSRIGRYRIKGFKFKMPSADAFPEIPAQSKAIIVIRK